MRNLLVAVAAIGLASCALTREQAQSMTSLELCERAYGGNAFDTSASRGVALNMVAERGDSCNNYAGVLAAQQANRWAMFGAGMALMQQSGPQPYPGQGSQTYTRCQQQGAFLNCTTY